MAALYARDEEWATGLGIGIFFLLGEFGLRERRERGLGVRELGFHVGLLGRVKYFGLGWLLFWF